MHEKVKRREFSSNLTLGLEQVDGINGISIQDFMTLFQGVKSH